MLMVWVSRSEDVEGSRIAERGNRSGIVGLHLFFIIVRLILKDVNPFPLPSNTICELCLDSVIVRCIERSVVSSASFSTVRVSRMLGLNFCERRSCKRAARSHKVVAWSTAGGLCWAAEHLLLLFFLLWVASDGEHPPQVCISCPILHLCVLAAENVRRMWSLVVVHWCREGSVKV